MSMIKRLGFYMLAVSLLGSACKKYADPPPYFEEYGEDSVTSQRKVLVITIDGLSGETLQEAQLPNIQKLMETSKYSFNQLKNVNSSDAAGWATLLTGVGFGKHQVHDSSFQYVPDESSEEDHEPVPYVPNILNYVLQSKPAYKSALVSPWANLVQYVAVTDYPYLVTGDAAVKDSAISLLKINTLGVMFLDFNGAELAGNAGSYDLSDVGFKTALDNIDGYIGEVVEALKARTTYASEDWLIMLTSPRGGSVDQSEPGFVIVSNEKLVKEELRKTGFNTVHFHGAGDAGVLAYVPNDNGLYNFGADQDFTFQLHVSVLGNANYPGFFGKTDGLYGADLTGWFLMQEGDHYNLEVGGTDNGGTGKNQTAIPTPIVGGAWHTITVSVKKEGGVRTAYIYTDGEFIASKNITSTGNINAKTPLSIGWDRQSGNATNFHAADIAIFDVALDEATIKANIDLKDMTKHPNYNDLIGYWPVDNGGGGLITNRAPRGYDMMLTGNFTWDAMGTDVPVSIEPDPSVGVSVVPVTEDIAANLFYWLKVEPEPSWGLQGQSWLEKFEREIYEL